MSLAASSMAPEAKGFRISSFEVRAIGIHMQNRGISIRTPVASATESSWRLYMAIPALVCLEEDMSLDVECLGSGGLVRGVVPFLVGQVRARVPCGLDPFRLFGYCISGGLRNHFRAVLGSYLILTRSAITISRIGDGRDGGFQVRKHYRLTLPCLRS